MTQLNAAFDHSADHGAEVHRAAMKAAHAAYEGVIRAYQEAWRRAEAERGVYGENGDDHGWQPWSCR